MKHLIKVDEVQHIRNNKILWEQKNIDNIFHTEGHYFLLNVAFRTASGIEVPSSYYIGLDNRTNLQASDTLSSLSAEPTQNAYVRQAVSSLNGFSVSLSNSDYRAITNVMTFSASGGSWGPVRNVFLTNTSGSSGYLISSVAFNSTRTVLDGESLTLRISVALAG